MQPDADVIVIGGGPGGSTAATLLRNAGHSVIVLEKEVFPRFHVGESMLPYSTPILEEIGVMNALKTEDFPRKVGAQFHLMNGSHRTFFVFRSGRFTRHTETIQVERARFDHLLLKRAAEAGADVREGWTVKRFAENADGVSVDCENPNGAAVTLHGRFLIDASGRTNLTANQLGLRKIHERHRKLSVFGHFANVKLDDGEARGDTVIVRLENRWFWIIPVSSEKTSVGLVLDKRDLEREGGDAQAAFWSAVEGSHVMRERMASANLQGSLRTTADFSYYNKTVASARVLRIGDAAGFMDPIFSAGVYLALWSAKLASTVATQALRNGTSLKFAGYERRVQKAMRVYWRLVEGFYTKPFIDLFMQPKPPLDMAAAVLALLAGELEGGWKIRWRLECFYFLVWLQGRRPIVPRLSYSSVARASHAFPSCETK